MNDYLSTHFTFEEMTGSNTAKRLHIDNTPNEVAMRNLKILCSQVLEPARKAWGRPIRVTSGYRSKKLNAAVGGKPNSYHLQGKAADLQVLNYDDGKHLCDILNNQLLTDIVLLEVSRHGFWIHVQWSELPRHQVNYHYNA